MVECMETINIMKDGNLTNVLTATEKDIKTKKKLGHKMEEVKETEEQKKERILNAFNKAKSNSYLRMMYGDAQLFYMFMEGMKYQKTGEMPQDILDNDDFLKNHEKYKV